MTQDTINQLLEIVKMHSEGQLTDEEYQTLKKQLMQGEAQPSNLKPQKTNNANDNKKKTGWKDNCDKYFKYSIAIALLATVISGAYSLLSNGQYKKGYVDASSIPVGEATSIFGGNANDTETAGDNVDYDTQMSADPDTDESKWSTVETEECKACNGFGKCPQCHGTRSIFIYPIGERPCVSINCDNGNCRTCGGKGKIERKKYKDIAIGSKHWRYSKKDKLRAAEKLMMRKIYILSDGQSANPNNQFFYTKFSDGFKESFSNAKGIFLYSVYLCPECKGKKCDKCYNGYVVTDCKITLKGTWTLVNGSQLSFDDKGVQKQTQVTGSKQCKFCYGRGYTIDPTHISVRDPNDTWFCKECGKYLEYYNYHVHRMCKNCDGDGQVDRGDPGYIEE